MSVAVDRRSGWSIAVAGIAGVVMAGAAAAAPPRGVVTETTDGALSTVVHYADLDLAEGDGVEALYRRLRAAAGRVCRPLQSPAPAMRRQWRECYGVALGNAVASVGNERLAALYREHCG